MAQLQPRTADNRLKLGSTVADPEFPRRGCQQGEGTPSYYLANFFPGNCMKMKETGPRERARVLSGPLLGSANDPLVIQIKMQQKLLLMIR